MRRKSEPALEIVPSGPPYEAAQLERMIAQIVEKRIAEATSGSDAIFQPFFQSKKLADEIRRRQTLAERDKFLHYFERWGCLICGTREHRHSALGMCGTCLNRTRSRLQTAIREHTPAVHEQQTFRDTVRLAREALIPSVQKLAGQVPAAPTAGSGKYRNQKQAAAEAGVSYDTLRLAIKSGKLPPPITKMGGKYLFSDEDIERIRELKSRGRQVSR